MASTAEFKATIYKKGGRMAVLAGGGAALRAAKDQALAAGADGT